MGNRDFAISVEAFLAMGGKLHTLAQCKATRKAGGPKNCVIHKPSLHPLIGSAMVVRGDGIIERICRHGVGHYDPDSVAYFEWVDPSTKGYAGIHGCDGCCRPLDKD